MNDRIADVPADETLDGQNVCTESAEDTEGLTRQEIRRNMTCCITLDAIFAGGYQDMMVAMQPLLVYLGASNTKIGALTGLMWLMWPGLILSPWISKKFPIKKWLFYGTNAVNLAPIGIAGMVIVLSHYLHIPNPRLLLYVSIALVAYNFFGGFVTVPMQEYTAAVIPMSIRGRFSGLSAGIGNLFSLAALAVSGWVLVHFQKPMSFGYLFLMSWFICQAGFTFALFAVEKPKKLESQPSPWSREMVKAAWNDKPWTRLLLVSSLNSIFYGQTLGFAAIYSYKVLHMSMANSAGYTAVRLIVGILFATWAGFLIDKYGAKRIIPLWWFGPGIAMIIVLKWPTPFGMYLAWLLWAVWQSLWATAQQVAFWSLPKPENRTGHYTLQVMVGAASGSIGLVFAGFLCDKLGYHTVFVINLIASFFFIPVTFWAAKALKAPGEQKT
jgi:MFS family permease